MKLEEIESKIAALKARKADLETKTLRLADGSWDGDAMAAESAVAEELKRLSALRSKALADPDSVVEPTVPPDTVRAAPKLRSAFDFSADDKDFPDPIPELSHLPEDQAALVEVFRKLFRFCTAQVNSVRSDFRQSKGNLEKGGYQVRYTQADHLAITTTIAFVHARALHVRARPRCAK